MQGERIASRLHHAVSAEPEVGLEPTNCKIVTCAEIKSGMLNQMIHSMDTLFLVL